MALWMLAACDECEDCLCQTDGGSDADTYGDTLDPNCDPLAHPFCCDADGTWKTDEVAQPAQAHLPAPALFWLRCPLGQTWEVGESCGCVDSPELIQINWCDAAGDDFPDGGAGYFCQSDHDGTDKCAQTFPDTDWRLPTAEEYSVLLEETELGKLDGKDCDGDEGATICTEMFGYDSRTYWSSTPHGEHDISWLANFDNGTTALTGPSTELPIRCVRDGS